LILNALKLASYLCQLSPELLVLSFKLPNLSLKEIEGIEAKVDKLGVSSLVVKLGGLSTYPSFVTDEASLRFVAQLLLAPSGLS